MKLLTLLSLIVMCGCSTVRVEPLALLQGQTEAILFTSRQPEEGSGRKVSVVGLPEILSRATWVEGRPFHKGGSWVRFTDGHEVFIPVAFEFVFVKGVPGYFEIRKEDYEHYHQIVQRIRKEANQSPQRTPAAARPPPLS